MILRLFILAVYLTASSLEAKLDDLPPKTELTPTAKSHIDYLDNLITQTEKTLRTAKELRQQIKDYLLLQEKFVQHTEDRDLALRMIKSAKQIQAIIDENHLTQAFDPDFLRELALFSQIGSKKSAPQP